MMIRKCYTLTNYNFKKNHVLNIIGPSHNTLEAIYNISFILYNNIPYAISNKSKCYDDISGFVPSYYKDLSLHVKAKSHGPQVVLNKCDIIQCKEIMNIQDYVGVISTEKWKTQNIFVVPQKQDAMGCHLFDITMCDKCFDKIDPKIFVLSDTIEEKVSFINKLLS